MNRLITILCALLLFSCNGDKPDAKAERKVFHYNQPNTVTSLDPAFSRNQSNNWAVNHLYNGLVQLDENLNVKPAIAKRWEISKDGMVYFFYLRDDVYFHDSEVFKDGKGRRVTAMDFVNSFTRIMDSHVGSPGAWIFKDRVADVEPFKAADENTFVIQMKKPFRPFLEILTMQYCSVVPLEATMKYQKDFRKNPVGTGPFKFVKWNENQTLILSKNENYFEKDASGNALPHLDGVRVSFINDRNTAYLEFKKGELDHLSGLESSYVNELLDKSGNLLPDWNGKINFIKQPFLNMEYLGISQRPNATKALKNKLVRQALNYAIDREKMLRELRNNVGQAAISGFTPRGLPSFSAEVKGYTYDINKAQELLKKAGYPNGKGMEPLQLFTNKDYLDLCTYITRQWEDLGIKTSIELMESATLRQMMAKGQAEFFRASWIADYPDAESFFTVFYGKNPAPPNYTQYNNEDFDKIYEAGLNENDNSRRYDMYHQMDAKLIEDAPVVFLFYDETAHFVKSNIKNLKLNAINLLELKRVRME